MDAGRVAASVAAARAAVNGRATIAHVDEVKVVACGPEAAADVHRLTQAAFAEYASLTPPSGAVFETE